MTRQHEELIGALVGLAWGSEGNEELLTADTGRLVADTLVTLGEESISSPVFEYLMKSIRKEKSRLAPNCALCTMPCGRTADYVASQLNDNPDDMKAAKRRILGLCTELSKRKGYDIGRVMMCLAQIGIDDPSLASFSRAIYMLEETDGVSES